MKNKETISRITAVIMAALMAAMSVSCSKEAAAHTATNQTSSIESAESEIEPRIRNLSELPDSLNFNGADFIVAARQTCTSVTTEALDGEIVNDSVYERNKIVEEQLNVAISEYKPDDIQTILLSGETVYSAYIHDISKMAGLVPQGFFYEVGSIPYIDLSKPYWSGGVTENLAISGKSYLFSGDIAIMDDQNIWCTLFNKELLKELNLENPYDALNEGKWTLDLMKKQTSAAVSDLDGDGQLIWNKDRFGLLNPRETLGGMYVSMGQTTFKQNSEGSYIYNLASEKSVSVMLALSEWMQEGKNSCFLEVSEIQSSDNVWIEIRRVFANGQSLYYNHAINTCANDVLREMEQDFGIMPFPKFDESQEEYISSVQQWGQCVYAVPLAAPNLDMSGAVLECMAGYSTDTLRAAYVDTALSRKYSRDDDSLVSINILFDNIVLDVGFCYHHSFHGVVLDAIDSGKVTSTAASSQVKEEQFFADLEETIRLLP